MISEQEKQNYLTLARWWVGRIFTCHIKGGGIGQRELLKYASFKPDFVVPADVVFNRGNHNILFRGKDGLETQPEILETEEMVTIDNSSCLPMVPIEALIENNGQYSVILIKQNSRQKIQVFLQSPLKAGEKKVVIKSGLKPADKIIVSRKNPEAGKLVQAPVSFKSSKEMDLFNYFCRLIRHAKEEIWKTETQEEVRLTKLLNKTAEIFYRAMIIKALPSIGQPKK